MVTKLLTKLLKPIIRECMANDAHSVTNKYMADMKRHESKLEDITDMIDELALRQPDANEIANNIHIDFGTMEYMFDEMMEKMKKIESMIILVREEKWGPEYWR
jgi:hypothetical protein